MNPRELRVELPPDLSNDKYATITHAVFSVLEVAEIAEGSMVRVDRAATDSDLSDNFDRHSEQYPWGR
ncbi:hypothetical protein AB0425_23995 [Actinosynnema sp. NPDC051121]